jgi:hypothetical protein
MATIRDRRPLDDLGGANLTLLLTLFDRKAWMIDLVQLSKVQRSFFL